MTRYVAFLRGVGAGKPPMDDLRRCFEGAGFTAVRTILASGNVAFDAPAARDATLERRIEQAMEQQLERVFAPVVRRSDALAALLAADPFARHRVPAGAKRVVSFLRTERAPNVPLPLHEAGATVLAVVGREAYTAYVAGSDGPVFMRLIEAAFGREVTSRTWETVARCAAA